MDDGTEEYLIRDIIDERRYGRGYRYLVRWVGYGPEEDRWLKGADVKDTEALDIRLVKRRTGMDCINNILFLLTLGQPVAILFCFFHVFPPPFFTLFSGCSLCSNPVT